MKKLSITIASLALLSTAAFASDRCNPSVGNWVNAAPYSCPDNGSGFGAGNGHGKPPSRCEVKRG